MSEETKKVYTKWVKKGENIFLPTDNSVIQKQLDCGAYDLRFSQGIGFYMLKKTIHYDELLEFPSNIHSKVLDSIKDFWGSKEKFIKYGFTFKRGILLHGKPGSGKTCIMSLATKYCIEELKGIVIALSSEYELELFKTNMSEIFRVIEPDRPIIVTIEDLDGLCRNTSAETVLLNILDGINQLENVVYLASTNYIENLKERIINRPSRFDRRIYVPFLDYDDRKFYFENKLHEDDLKAVNLAKWCKDTDGMSIAHLAELIKSVCILGIEYEEVLSELKRMNDIKETSYKYEKNNKTIGFAAVKNIPEKLFDEVEDEGLGEEIDSNIATRYAKVPVNPKYFGKIVINKDYL